MKIRQSRSMLVVLAAAAAVIAVGSGMPRAADVVPSKRDAEQLRRKIQLITENGLLPQPQARRTPVTESEVNSYLAFDARDQLPAGVVEPYVTILGAGRVGGRAVVDLDAVRRGRSSAGLFDPLNYLTGRLPVSMSGLLRTSNGIARFELESAAIAGVGMPKALLQELLTYYSRTPANPHGLNLDDPFPLPVRIREIEVGKGEAIVVQ